MVEKAEGYEGMTAIKLRKNEGVKAISAKQRRGRNRKEMLGTKEGNYYEAFADNASNTKHTLLILLTLLTLFHCRYNASETAGKGRVTSTLRVRFEGGIYTERP
jgi:hypothetical protein